MYRQLESRRPGRAAENYARYSGTSVVTQSEERFRMRSRRPIGIGLERVTEMALRLTRPCDILGYETTAPVNEFHR